MTTALVLQDPEIAALLWLNEARAELGLYALNRLPCGERHSAGSCPLANGLVEYDKMRLWIPHAPIVCNTHASVSGLDIHRWTLPLAVTRFIGAFDGGAYPHLEVPR